MQRLIDSLRQAVPDGLEEIQTLAKTLISRSQDTPGLLRPAPYLQRPRARPSTGAWNTNAASPWDLRNLASYTICSLIHTGRLKDHLTTTTSTSRQAPPTYHTPKHEEPVDLGEQLLGQVMPQARQSQARPGTAPAPSSRTPAEGLCCRSSRAGPQPHIEGFLVLLFVMVAYFLVGLV